MALRRKHKGRISAWNPNETQSTTQAHKAVNGALEKGGEHSRSISLDGSSGETVGRDATVILQEYVGQHDLIRSFG